MNGGYISPLLFWNYFSLLRKLLGHVKNHWLWRKCFHSLVGIQGFPHSSCTNPVVAIYYLAGNQCRVAIKGECRCPSKSWFKPQLHFHWLFWFEKVIQPLPSSVSSSIRENNSKNFIWSLWGLKILVYAQPVCWTDINVVVIKIQFYLLLLSFPISFFFFFFLV